jgi:hypothetical protein
MERDYERLLDFFKAGGYNKEELKDMPDDDKTPEQWKEEAKYWRYAFVWQTKSCAHRIDTLDDELEKIRALVGSQWKFSIVEDLEKLLNDKLGDKQKMKKQIKELQNENAALHTAFKALTGRSADRQVE